MPLSQAPGEAGKASQQHLEVQLGDETRRAGFNSFTYKMKLDIISNLP